MTEKCNLAHLKGKLANKKSYPLASPVKYTSNNWQYIRQYHPCPLMLSRK